jgi:hypothetical protein
LNGENLTTPPHSPISMPSKTPSLTDNLLTKGQGCSYKAALIVSSFTTTPSSIRTLPKGGLKGLNVAHFTKFELNLTAFVEKTEIKHKVKNKITFNVFFI